MAPSTDYAPPRQLLPPKNKFFADTPSLVTKQRSFGIASANKPANLSVQTTAILQLRESTTFEQLPLRPGLPPYAAWGIFGEEDQLGTLNLLTSAAVLRASEEIKHGITIPLNLPIDIPRWPMNPLRKPCKHNI